MPTISGTVYDDTGQPVAGRIVRVYRRDTGAMLASATTGDGVSVGDPFFSNVALLLHMDGTNGSTTFTDSSPSPKIVTSSGNAQISTAQSRWGGASAYFDGAGDALAVASGVAPSGAQNFTIEGWFYVSALPSSGNVRIIFNAENPANASQGVMNVEISSSGAVGAFLFPGSNYTSGGSVTLNTWHHLALTRSGSSWWLFLNGTQVGTTITNTLSFSAGLPFNVGYQPAVPARAWLGWIDDVRVTLGVARYTANFTPPTAPFPNANAALPLGQYLVDTGEYAGECNVICLDDAAGTVYNDLIHRTFPSTHSD